MDMKLEKLIGKKVKHIETEYDDLFEDGTILDLFGKADCNFYTVYKE